VVPDDDADPQGFGVLDEVHKVVLAPTFIKQDVGPFFESGNINIFLKARVVPDHKGFWKPVPRNISRLDPADIGYVGGLVIVLIEMALV
jgi:hypothetical protein